MNECPLETSVHEDKTFQQCPCCVQCFRTKDLLLKHVTKSHASEDWKEVYDKLVANHEKTGKNQHLDEFSDENSCTKPALPPEKNLWNFKCDICQFQHESQSVMETHYSKVW